MEVNNEFTAGRLILKILRGVFIAFIVMISVLPFLWVFIASFQANGDIISGAMRFSQGLKYENYIKAFRIAPLAQFYGIESGGNVHGRLCYFTVSIQDEHFS